MHFGLPCSEAFIHQLSDKEFRDEICGGSSSLAHRHAN
jgi:hypothetical protein